LRTCLAQAIQLDVLTANPMDRVPRPQTGSGKPKLWTLPEVKRFLDVCRASQRSHADLLAFLLLSGARLSEALALTWRDVDLQGGMIRIEKALVWVANQWSIETPKSQAGHRVVHLHPDAVALLRSRPRGLDVGERIFVTKTGEPPRKDNLSRLMKALCQEAVVPRIRVHDLRHVHAALCVVGGLDVKGLQQRLGHSRASVSLDIYSYAMGSEQRAVDAIHTALTS
jgi:integrase